MAFVVIYIVLLNFLRYWHNIHVVPHPSESPPPFQIVINTSISENILASILVFLDVIDMVV